jgi:serine phosphatase RsbU (regulator of sigma subunit)
VPNLGGNKKSSTRLPSGGAGATPQRPPTGAGAARTPSPGAPRPPTGAGAPQPPRKTPAGSGSGGASHSSTANPVAKKPTPGSGYRPSPAAGSGGSGVMAAAKPAARGHGSVAGRRVQGMGLALKLSLSIAALVILVVAAWGTVLANIVQNSSYDAIKRYGAAAALCLGRIGREEVQKYRDWSAAHPQGGYQAQAMPELLNLLPAAGGQSVKADIADAVILRGAKSPQTLIASASGILPRKLKGDRVEQIAGHEYSNVTCEFGTFERERNIKAFYFKVPVSVPGDPEPSSAVLILAAEQVDNQVNSIIASAFIAGIICLLAGIGVSYVLAGGIVKPVRGLMRDMDTVSRGDFDHITKATSKDEIGLLAMAFNDMTRSLQAARELEHEAERVQGEINTTREIQAHLLPAKIPQLPGFDIYQAYSSAKEVGGDYFDYIPVDRENLGIVVADVSGKGLPGAMVMAQTRAVLRMIATGNTSASATLSQVNTVIARDIKRGMFVTMIYGILNVRQKTLTVASAGHNPMVLLRARTGQVELVNPNGIALGFDKGPIFNRTIKEQTLQLYKGDQVVLYTDGVVEAMDERHEEYTDERFYRWVQSNARDKKSRDVVSALLKEIETFRGKAEQHDDITVVTVRVE